MDKGNKIGRRNKMSSNNEAHGDEDWIAAEARECAELYEAEHADYWKTEGYNYD